MCRSSKESIMVYVYFYLYYDKFSILGYVNTCKHGSKNPFFFLLEWVPWKTCHYAHTWTYSNNSYLGWNLVFPHRPQSSKILPKIWRFVRGGPIFPIDLNIMWVYPNFINFASNYYISNFKAIRQYLTFPHVPPFLLK